MYKTTTRSQNKLWIQRRLAEGNFVHAAFDEAVEELIVILPLIVLLLLLLLIVSLIFVIVLV